MNLKIHERVFILNILPKEGNSVTARLIQDTIKSIGLTPEEIENWKVKVSQNRVNWDENIDTTTSIELSNPAKELIVSQLKKLEEENQLPVAQLCVYDKFCRTGGDENPNDKGPDNVQGEAGTSREVQGISKERKG